MNHNDSHGLEFRERKRCPTKKNRIIRLKNQYYCQVWTRRLIFARSWKSFSFVLESLQKKDGDATLVSW